MLELDQIFVTAAQMQHLETAIFNQGMPIPALMEKAAGLIAQYIQNHYPLKDYRKISVLVGPGHNGGDALVVARELSFAGYEICLFRPLEKLKSLTQSHWDYAQFLGIPHTKDLDIFLESHLIIDGLFGFGLTRPITGDLGLLIDELNESGRPIVSIDLPSGLHTDTGAVLGTAIQATESLCLGLWKRAYGQDAATPYLGKINRLDFGIPSHLIAETLSAKNTIQGISQSLLQRLLPLGRSPLTHKYKQGHLLLIGGSQTYLGSVLLAALGARATGIGMLTIAVPESLKLLVVAQLPEALVLGCPEDETGAIAQLPSLDFSRYQAVACGCGLTLAGATNLMPDLMPREVPLVLDADALNWLAEEDLEVLQNRHFPTILTPHLGEFKRLFADQIPITADRFQMTQKAAQLTGAIALLKGAKTVIARPDGVTHCITESTPALARGGSGDVLLGLIGGLLAQHPEAPLEVATAAAWWHAQAGIRAAQARTVAGVDGVTLAEFLVEVLQQWQTKSV
ncbi:bifunctional ADP-dependent NAD(P)H-hydrate dehydratase/NAD(P)H-hydrate epimerase [Picosynechococcus sp. PCC 8807]|uniref:bifunctional ADP-dependent NAD(P)H-hydrate dehydratase/NAD(P)H-hydrate epimerase n=1 Tax=Picosynechococcus sp. PCC 8807 TaxID=195248 RepID=UPI000810C05D|nr:bifunctional ADP-dependent NAD(P)H-hydrate dehydratase/NAD(P)H-hydrate epimerase [Picosynechococcus sp. PCC 8807]ANV89745.1 bifunctional ADP-dependent (S)-NAD(P)H-hydrate dehydratase/NAD(P)H-hydrate epimerase [Picosynechococcus sp. PCC 8807]